MDGIVEGNEILFFLAGHAANFPAAAQRPRKRVVGVDVQLHLPFALNVVVADVAQDIRQTGLINFAVDHFCGQSYGGEQGR